MVNCNHMYVVVVQQLTSAVRLMYILSQAVACLLS